MTERLDDYVSAYGVDFEYEFDNELMLNWYPRRIMALTSPKSRVLELGIGHGYTCNHFSEFYAEYSVVDGSGQVIDKFKNQYPNSKAKIFHSYFEDFSGKQKFDLIIMGFILEHVDDPGEILEKFKQFLTPNGKCFLSVPNAESLHRRFGHEAGLLPDMLVLGDGDLALGHKRLYTVDSLSQQLETCGYRVTRKEGVFLKPLTTGQLRSLNLSGEVLEGMCKVGVNYPELSASLLFEATVVK